MELSRSYNFEFDYGFIEDTVKTIVEKKDEKLRQITAYLLNVWVTQQLSEKRYLFIKHVVSNKRNKLYQVLLSGDYSDGVYELSLKNNQINVSFKKDSFKNIALNINSCGNYDAALFKGSKVPDGYNDKAYNGSYGYSIVRADYDTDENFKKALINQGLVTDEEYNMYCSQNNAQYAKNKSIVVFD